jgi:hypothetical protein
VIGRASDHANDSKVVEVVVVVVHDVMAGHSTLAEEKEGEPYDTCLRHVSWRPTKCKVGDIGLTRKRPTNRLDTTKS